MSIERTMDVDGQTLGELLENRAHKTPDNIAYLSKQNGSFVATSWENAYQQACNIASGLIEQGIGVGDKVAILSKTRLEWTLSDFGIVLCGAVSVPLYPSNPKEICTHILSNSDAKVVFAEDMTQLEKILEIQSELPFLKSIILFDEPPAHFAKNTAYTILSLQQLCNEGQNSSTAKNILDARKNQISAQSIASIMYTSGTTGLPKGVLVTHEAYTVGTKFAVASTGAFITDVQLSFLPMAHSFGKMLSVYAVRVGFCTAFAESIEKLIDNASEIHPTIMVCVPRIFEKVYSGFLNKAKQSGFLKQKLIFWAVRVGKRWSQLVQHKDHIPILLRIQKAIADILVFSKLRQKLGGKIRWFISGSAPLHKEIMEFFHGAGLMILEGYGLTETNSITTVNRLDDFKFGTVGKPHDSSIKIKIAEDGEILTKGITNFLGYHKLDKETKESFDADGWFRTGDIGELDQDGFLKITDRKKDLIKTSAGKFVAPQYIEGKLKLNPLISQAVVVGDHHKYITALIAINLDAAKQLLQNSSISITDDNLKYHKIITSQIQYYIDTLNKSLGSWEQIKYFKVLPSELSEAKGEVTPSLKIKRNIVVQKYRELIESMYQEHFLPEEHN